ncbi:hypothetical protein IWW50_000420, partial [Coemansia erecta]
MATAYNRYTFSITLRGDAQDSAVEVTAFFTNSDDPRLVTLHAEKDAADAAVFSAVLDVAQPQAISHAEYRVDGDAVATSTPVAAGASSGEATDTPDHVAAVSITFAEHTAPADAAGSDDDDSAIATPLSEIQ